MSSHSHKRSSSTSSSSTSSSSPKRQPVVARPSSSVILVSPTNQVLLLHRVKTSSAFASAHVFPGGNLDPFHDGDIPAPESPERHRDGKAYRMGAIRECFEETGILLAKRRSGGGKLAELDKSERDEMRKKVHAGKVKFGDWLESIDCEADTAGLMPCTRWLTPPNLPKRFTTQMYLYFLPIANSSLPSQFLIPTPDGGVEHTAALFASPQHFLQAAAGPVPTSDSSQKKPIILFPPQYFLLQLLARYFSGGTASLEEGPLHFTTQRKKLIKFLKAVPTAEAREGGDHHPTAKISWADKMICPSNLLVRKSDGKSVLGLDKSGAEVKDLGRGGVWEKVAVVKFTKEGPREVEIRSRQEVLQEERETQDGGSKL